jgi:DNA-binding HxlR family transcriptional regulator
MKRMTIEECPVKVALDVVRGKWKPLILYYLKEQPQHYGELLRQVSGITKKVLTQQIRELEHDGIVVRKVVVVGKLPSVEYSLSPMGRSLSVVLESMARWVTAHRR